ncbi:MAG: energy transducer TonB [Cytophagales bacterium]|nr:MAG: energy transducer TonB [Cytophagales bacterium]
MKIILFTSIYLMVNSSVVLGQHPTGFAASQASLVSTTPNSDEFVPNDNDPFFPGGIEALREYLKESAPYPRQARMAQIEGTVRVRFRVQPTGYLTDIQVVESGGEVLNRSALRAIAQMPRWFPSHRNGEAVARSVVMPITFRME